MTRVLGVLLTFLASLATAAEIPLTTPVIAPSTFVQNRPNPTIAVGASTILTAWEERSMAAWPNTAETVIRMFNRDGEPLQRTFVSLGDFYAPKAIWNGSDYFIVFSRYISRFGSLAPIPAVDAVRVREDGTIVEGSHVTIASSTHAISVRGIAWNGQQYLVAAEDQIIGVAPDGKVLTGKAFPGGLHGATAFGDGFFILATVQSELVADRVSASGRAVENHPLSTDPIIYGGAIAQNGSTVAAVWSTADAIYAAFMDDHSTSAPKQIANVGPAQLNSLAWDGGAWITTWQKGDSLCRARFDALSVPVTVCDRIQPGNSAQPVIASDGSTTALAWIEALPDGSASTTDLVKLSIDSAGHLPETQRGQTISLAAQPLSQPAVAPDGNRGLIAAWSMWNALERRTEVHLGGLTANGSARPDQMISMAASSPRVAFGQKTAWMVWIDGRLSSPYIEGGRIDPSASIRLGMDSEASFGEGTAPHVAADGKEFLVVWQSPQAADGTSQIMTEVIPESMELPRPPSAPIGSIVTRQFSPSVDWSGRGFLATWLEYDANPPASRVVAQLLDPSGKAFGPRAIISGSENFESFSSAATTTTCGTTCLVTWMRMDGSFMGATLSTDGTFASKPFTITHVTLPYQSEPAVTATGSTFSIYLPSYGPAPQIVIDSFGNVLSRRVIAPDASGGIAATMVGGTPWIVYARSTMPEELYGGSTLLFASPVFPLRRRSADSASTVP